MWKTELIFLNTVFMGFSSVSQVVSIRLRLRILQIIWILTSDDFSNRNVMRNSGEFQWKPYQRYWFYFTLQYFPANFMWICCTGAHTNLFLMILLAINLSDAVFMELFLCSLDRFESYEIKNFKNNLKKYNRCILRSKWSEEQWNKSHELARKVKLCNKIN